MPVNQKGVVYTEEGGQNEATAEAVMSPTAPVTQAYSVVVATRPYRFDTDGWDYTKSQTTITVNRPGGSIV